jgi:hypothetical protein
MTDNTVQPYPAGTQWTFHVLAKPSLIRTEELIYLWEPDASWITDDYLPSEITPRELWDKWCEKAPYWLAADHPHRYTPGDINISWYIRDLSNGGTAENSPYRQYEPNAVEAERAPETFLTFHSHPVHSVTGEPLNWLRLPVMDKGWSAERDDKGGFIQELLGWKPAPLQPVMNVFQLAQAAGIG